LDENEWVARFLDASGQNSETTISPNRDWVSFALNVSTNRVQGEESLKMRWVGVVALLLLLCGLGWFVWGFVRQRIASLPHPTATHHVATARAAFVMPSVADGDHQPNPFTANIRTS
jgi:hypothetical protein